MGQEIHCRADWKKQTSQGRALLETAEVLFRGEFRLKIPFASITAMKVSDGELRIDYEGESAVLHLGPAAGEWAARIRNPPSRLDKLGVKPGMRVHLAGRFDAGFRGEIKERGAAVSKTKADLVFLAVGEKSELAGLARFAAGTVWVIYPKGIKTVTENDVRSAGLAAGMVDIKVCAFSASHTGLKFTPRRQDARPRG